MLPHNALRAPYTYVDRSRRSTPPWQLICAALSFLQPTSKLVSSTELVRSAQGHVPATESVSLLLYSPPLRFSADAMRSYLCVALLATTLYFTAEARQLTQEAISNSNGCLPTIPRCDDNACVVRNLGSSGAGWACQRCKGTYEAVVDGSGQDNIIQCGKCEVQPGTM